MASGNVLTVIPVTSEDSIILRQGLPSKVTQDQDLEELQQYIDDVSKHTPDFLKLRKKLVEEMKLPAGPCYITSHLYDKSGKLVHVVGRGEFNGLDEDGKPMLLYSKEGLPRNADGSVRAITLPEMLAIQKKNTEEAQNLPSYLPRRPKLVKRKMKKLRKNPPPRKIMDDFDEMVAKEAERLRRMNERL